MRDRKRFGEGTGKGFSLQKKGWAGAVFLAACRCCAGGNGSQNTVFSFFHREPDETFSCYYGAWTISTVKRLRQIKNLSLSQSRFPVQHHAKPAEQDTLEKEKGAADRNAFHCVPYPSPLFSLH
jgi:hypothetical protein